MASFERIVIDEKPLVIVDQISISDVGWCPEDASHFHPVALLISTNFCFVKIWNLHTFKFQHGREINKHYEFEVEAILHISAVQLLLQIQNKSEENINNRFLLYYSYSLRLGVFL